MRAGARRTVVEGVLDLPAGHPALVRAEEAGADTGDGLVLVRTVGADGRSRAHVGGRAAPVGVLGDLAEHLVAVHGQADQWRLRRTEEHREVLDAFGGPEVAEALATYRAVHAELQETEAELADLRTAAEARAREAESLRLGLERIEAVDPAPAEDALLRAESDRLGHAEELRAAAGAAHTVLHGSEDDVTGGGTLEALAQVSAGLMAAASTDPALAGLVSRVDEIRYLAADVAADLGSYLADLDVDPARLDQVEQRRARLTELTRLYGPTVEDVLAWAGTAAARVAELEGTGDRIEELAERVAALSTRRAHAASTLTERRRAAAVALGERITAELGHLAMGTATVSVAVEDAGRFGADGADTVEVRLAPGPGAPARSVTRAASGGELSRVMLAVEVATSEAGPAVPTFVFDEVDAGVGGRAALDVGARLAALARHAQVVVVTHLAQVAAHADRHLVVERADDGHVTRSMVREATGEERVAELARMLGGSGTEAALEHARDLLGRARA
ncbi:DNA repair protein RecN [Phycicoccus endophyticus]|uniref:DNA repair protein RecN n=1 Tax=Phycicoccus endophyticus TaxID=1690220 RepID=UPI0030B86344